MYFLGSSFDFNWISSLRLIMISDQGKEDLFKICNYDGSGDVMEVKKILDDSPSFINEVTCTILSSLWVRLIFREDLNVFGEKVLILASSNRYIEIIKFLLTQEQLDVNQQDIVSEFLFSFVVLFPWYEYWIEWFYCSSLGI